MPRFAPRLAAAIDAVHVALIVCWIGGFALYPWFPRFRLWHAALVILAGLHQLALGNRCILTIASRRLRGLTTEQVFIRCVPARLETTLTWLSVAVAVLTVISTLRP